MQQIFYELSVLAKSVNFKNLSAAALHVGLSQPQLSRIIAKIELELKIVLLDRSTKRKSGWTPAARHLAQIFEKSAKRLELDLFSVSKDQMVSEVHLGTLEGLAPTALKLAKMCFDSIGIHKIFLDIYDLSELDANFLNGNLDLILSSKQPGRKKTHHCLELGFQHLEKVQTHKDFSVMSTFEYGQSDRKTQSSFKHMLISNSLVIRKEWFKSPGGTGFLPSEARSGKSKEAEPVWLLGSELLNPQLWLKITEEMVNNQIL
ncbi:MAG: LysR family transcriptional regulator [Bdellovibrionota bacterium]